MNAKTIFAINVVVGAAFTAAALKLGHKWGQEDGINKLRREQLEQAQDDRERAQQTLRGRKVSLDEFQELMSDIEDCYERECAQINEMYDEIINNL